MVPANERQEFLSTIPIFAGLNEAALSELVRVAEEVSVDDKQVIVREGEAGNRMFIIHTGRVEVVKYLGQPKETILAMFGPRDFLGEMSMIECVTRSASLRAAETVPTRACRRTRRAAGPETTCRGSGGAPR